MNARDLRKKYLEFFNSKSHTSYPSGSLIPYDVTGKLDESLLFNGAGMVQFKPYFRGIAKPSNNCLTTAQKCMRTVDIEEVGDLSHLTFFEMLGNFSFGSYFKKEAIEHAWEFLTDSQWLSLDPEKLCCTVFEEDSESEEYWKKFWTEAGYNPANKIFKLSEKTNYWPAGAFTSGPPGPCGPNSEIFYWTGEGAAPKDNYTKEDYLADEAEGKWLEIWNLVFIQSEWQGKLKDPTNISAGYEKTGMPDLPFKSIDTGMGLERTAAVLLGKKSVYETDVFTPILKCLSDLKPGGIEYGKSDEQDIAIRIILDHIRTACFCIADGILPGNTGRGYVLRRLIRRAVLKGQRVLDFNEPFFHKVYEGVKKALGDHYHELIDRSDVITETLQSEEELFRRTLKTGYSLLKDELDKLKAGQVLSGEQAFKLYDTYGFPLEVTKEICDENSIKVDINGYSLAMSKAQELSRSSGTMDTVYGAHQSEKLELLAENAPEKTEFLGYKSLFSEGMIIGVKPLLDSDKRVMDNFEISLDKTPFYAESGGQVGDQGVIKCRSYMLDILDTKKRGARIWHIARVSEVSTEKIKLKGLSAEEGVDQLKSYLLSQNAICEVDSEKRKRTECNHTATHLLHSALRKTLGKHVTQAGSLVNPEYLRFDFTHGKALTANELAEVESIVNQNILTNMVVKIHEDIALEEARARGAMALFGEKYSDKVRMVQIDDISLELCGGTHLPQTGNMGLFKIIHECSAASGIRRIEAVTADSARNWYIKKESLLKEASEILKSNPNDILPGIEKLIAQNKDLQKKIEKMRTQSNSSIQADIEQVGSIELVSQVLSDSDANEAKILADSLSAEKVNRVVFITAIQNGKATFVCKVGSDAVKSGAHAGNIIREIAKMAGGGGGGRPDFATAGAKESDKLNSAITSLKSIVAQQLEKAQV